MSEAIETADSNATPPEGGAQPPSETSVPPADDAPASSQPSASDGGATLMDDPGEETPVSAPSHWPENWRDIASGGDKTTLQYLNRYASPANVVKALMATRQKISLHELLRNRPDDEDQDALSEWRAQAGIPEKPEGYLDNMPDGLVIGEDDQPNLNSFLVDMHQADVPPTMVHKAISWYYQAQEKQLAELAQRDNQSRMASEDTLRAEWGPEYRSNIQAANALLQRLGGDELRQRLLSARMGDGVPLGNDPEMLKFLVSIEREINPFGTPAPQDGKTITETIKAEKEALEAEMRDTKARTDGGYWANPAKQQRYRELLEMEERQAKRGK